MKRVQLWVGVIISIVFLWWALREFKWPEVWQALRTARYYWIIPGVLVYMFGVWARTWRWHYMLRPFKSVRLTRLFPVVCIGYMGNNIFPFRAGEVLRSWVLKQTEDIPISGSLATVLVERVFDGLVMLLFVFIALPFATNIPDVYRTWVVGFSLMFGVALIVIMLIAARPDLTRRFYDGIASRVIPPHFRAPVGELIDKFVFGLTSLRSGRDVLMIFATSVVIWLAETMKYWFIMHAFDFETSFFILMLMNGVVNLFTSIPSSPGYVGTFDAPGIEILTVAGGINRQIATAYTLVLHVALWLPITLLGLYFFYREQLQWSDIKRASQAVAQSDA